MTNEQKTQIVEQIDAFVARYKSQNKAAKAIGVSSGTISAMRNGKWENIADEMWREIAHQVGGTREWEVVETEFFKTFTTLLDDAKRNSFVYAVTAEAGSGKTFACKYFTSAHRNVFHITCCEIWSLQAFLGELLKALGLERKANNNNNLCMMNEVISAIKKLENPLIILDEADKLRPQILYSLISIYNELEDVCGIVICATPHLQTKIERGVDLGKMGYNELYSRIGRKFLELPVCKKSDIAAICTANGVSDPDDHAEIANDSGGDLRRVKRLCHVANNR